MNISDRNHLLWFLNSRTAGNYAQTALEAVMKYGPLNLGQIEALVNKLGGMEKVAEILGGKYFPDSNLPVMKFSGEMSIVLSTDKFTNMDFLSRLNYFQVPFSEAVRMLTHSLDCDAHVNKTHNVRLLSRGGQCSLEVSCQLANRQGLTAASPEIILPLIEGVRNGLLDGLGLSWVVIAHNPVCDEIGIERVLALHLIGPGQCKLAAVHASRFAGNFASDTAFVYAEPCK
jgi:hypothetical protein